MKIGCKDQPSQLVWADYVLYYASQTSIWRKCRTLLQKSIGGNYNRRSEIYLVLSHDDIVLTFYYTRQYILNAV